MTFVPPGAAVDGVSKSLASGVYSLSLWVPGVNATSLACYPRADNLTVVVRDATGYNLVDVDLPHFGTDLGDVALAGYFLELGNFTFIANTTALVTVDNSGTPAGQCVAVDAVKMAYLRPVQRTGCTDPLAVNYEPDAVPHADDDEDGQSSCLYIGGEFRGPLFKKMKFLIYFYVSVT